MRWWLRERDSLNDSQYNSQLKPLSYTSLTKQEFLSLGLRRLFGPPTISVPCGYSQWPLVDPFKHQWVAAGQPHFGSHWDLNFQPFGNHTTCCSSAEPKSPIILFLASRFGLISIYLLCYSVCHFQWLH